jgi:hypothetical protein
MKKMLFVLLAVVAVAGCGDSTNTDSEEGNNGGKADQANNGAAACTLADEDTREINQFVLNDHVQYRCSGDTGFVANACCATQIEEYTAASTCPLQAKWNDADGTDRRCVADTALSDGSEFVPTACCAALCGSDVSWREQENGTFCVNGDGQFENSACCLVKDRDICDASEYDEFVSADERRHCRNPGTGRFAPAGCCVDKCFDIIAGGEIVPESCLARVEAECENAALNAGNLCANADSGRFVKAACCDYGDDVDAAQIADDAFLCEEVNDDIIRCQTGDEDACDRSDKAIDDGTLADGCCGLDRAQALEFCF